MGRTGSSGPLQQKYDGVFSQCRRWTQLSRISISTFTGPSMCSLFYLLLSLKKETTLLLMLSVINKLSTLTVSSMINFFFKNLNCLIRPSLYCLIHFYKRICTTLISTVVESAWLLYKIKPQYLYFSLLFGRIDKISVGLHLIELGWNRLGWTKISIWK